MKETAAAAGTGGATGGRRKQVTHRGLFSKERELLFTGMFVNSFFVFSNHFQSRA